MDIKHVLHHTISFFTFFFFLFLWLVGDDHHADDDKSLALAAHSRSSMLSKRFYTYTYVGDKYRYK